MMEDVYLEQLFPVKTPKTYLFSFLALSLAILIGAIFVLLYVPYILLIYAFLSACLILYCNDALYVEYEYALVNENLTVAIIYNKKRRAVIYEADLKSLLSADSIENQAAFVQAKSKAKCDLSPNYYAKDANLHYFALDLSQAQKSNGSLLQLKGRLHPLSAKHTVIVAFNDKLVSKTLRFLRRVNPSLQI